MEGQLPTRESELTSHALSEFNSRTHAVISDFTSRQQKTYRTTFEEVCYPWHRRFGRRAVVIEELRRPDLSILRCRLEDDESSRALELPRWMLDRASCVAKRAAILPAVPTPAASGLPAPLLFGGH
jgi:hypothetical protein